MRPFGNSAAPRPFRLRRRRARRRRPLAAAQPWRPLVEEEPADWDYSSVETHRLMLRDDLRNEAYRRGIAASVRPGDVVLDFGAGTGILSMFAAQAGASRVYAVERTTVVRLARRLIKRNGFDDRIVVIRGDIEHVNLPENVDVIVSEWLGTFGVDENMLAPLVLARDRWLKPGGRLVPAEVSAWIAPIWNDELAAETLLRTGRPYGLDLSLVVDQPSDGFTWSWEVAAPEALATAPARLWTTDVHAVGHDEASASFKASLALEAVRSCRVNALTAWFTADFGSGITLDNAPTSPPTHWGQYIFPLQGEVVVSKGDSIGVQFTSTPAGPGYSTFAWSFRQGEGAWEHHESAG